MVRTSDHLVFFFAVFIGVLAALLVWTVIVKQQIQATLATSSASNPLLSLLTNL